MEKKLLWVRDPTNTDADHEMSPYKAWELERMETIMDMAL